MKVLRSALNKALFVSVSILLTLMSSVVFAQSSVSKAALSSKKSLQGSTFSQGGVSDGGSTGIYIGSRLLLLDLYVANPLGHGEAAGSPLHTQAGKPWPRVVVKEQPAFRLALQLIDQSKASRITKKVIVQALSYMEFWSIEDEFPVKRAYLPEWLAARAQGRVKTIAMYGEEYGGAAISKRAWDELGAISQAGVLIHEALRHIQFVDEETESTSHLSDKVIQELTAHIVLGSPIESKELGWFFEFLESVSDIKARESKIANICQSIQTKFPEAFFVFDKFCTTQVPIDDVEVLNFVARFAETATDMLPYMLASKKRYIEFLAIRDEAQLLYLKTLQGSLLITKFGFMQLRYQLNSIAF